MGLIDKLATAVRGGTREVIELAVDANALRILAQEIHECEEAVCSAKQDLCRVAAERIQLRREAGRLQAAIAEKEQQAGKALDRREDGLALEVAQWITEREPQLQDLRRKQRQLEIQETRLKQRLRTVIVQIETFRREQRTLQATARAQSATEKINCSTNRLPNKLDEVQLSLQRIRGRQQHLADRLEAAETIEQELYGGSLDDRLRVVGSAGISAKGVLDRIRRRRAKDGSEKNGSDEEMAR